MLDLASVTVDDSSSRNLVLPPTTNDANITDTQVTTTVPWNLSNDFIRCSCKFIGSLKVKGEDYEYALIAKLNFLDDNTLINQHVKPRYGYHLSNYGLATGHLTEQFTLTNMHHA